MLQLNTLKLSALKRLPDKPQIDRYLILILFAFFAVDLLYFLCRCALRMCVVLCGNSVMLVTVLSMTADMIGIDKVRTISKT